MHRITSCELVNCAKFWARKVFVSPERIWILIDKLAVGSSIEFSVGRLYRPRFSQRRGYKSIRMFREIWSFDLITANDFKFDRLRPSEYFKMFSEIIKNSN